MLKIKEMNATCNEYSTDFNAIIQSWELKKYTKPLSVKFCGSRFSAPQLEKNDHKTIDARGNKRNIIITINIILFNIFILHLHSHF